MRKSFRSPLPRWTNLLMWCGLLLVMVAGPYQAQETAVSPDQDVDRLKRATVFITQVESENLTTTCVGTGTLVSYDGLILTNAHHTVLSESCPGDILFIALTLNVGEPPVPKYRAEVVQSDIGLDLALLRITQDFDGRLLERDRLPILPFVPLASELTVDIDDTITMIGYPDIGNSELSSLRGTLTSFVAERSGGEQSWLKVRTVDAESIAGTMSGGGVFSRTGELVGVLTSAPIPSGSSSTDCVVIEDSNIDGFINNNDRCVPLGGFISVARSVEAAQPLVQAGSLGLQVTALTTPTFSVQTQGEPSISTPFFAPAVVNSQPTTVLKSAPAGTDSLFLFFDYRNMTPETVYEVRVTVDGLPNEALSLPPVRWSGGTNGLWYIGTAGQTRPNGRYEYRVFINGELAAEAPGIEVGGPALEAPQFSNVTFGLLDENGNLGGSGYVLPTGNTATARFIHRNMVPGQSWTSVWSFNGQRIASSQVTGAWQDTGDINAAVTNLQPAGGLQPGNYRLELFIDNSLSSLGDFTVAGSQVGPLARVFTNIEFRRAESVTAEPNRTPGTNYPDGAHTVYSYFDWEQIEAGTLWTLQWSVDNQVFYRQTVPWSAPPSGDDYTIQLTAPGGLPDGTYKLELLINDVLLAESEVSIGIGQLPIDRFNQSEGVRLRGRIVDVETNEGIDGVAFLLISELFSIEDFEWRENQLYALAITDREGYFEVDRPLEFDAPYSVLVEVDGYLPLGVDGFEISRERLAEEGGNPLELRIELTRD